MASITISGGGSIPSRSKGFSSEATPEGHSRIFGEVDAFIAEWKDATKAQDSASAATADTTEATPADAGGEAAPAE